MRVEDGEVYIHYDTQTQRHVLDSDPEKYTGLLHCRQTVVYLKCNSTIKDPIMTTTGDSRLILFYVCPTYNHLWYGFPTITLLLPNTTGHFLMVRERGRPSSKLPTRR